jgi:hypothetical protein
VAGGLEVKDTQKARSAVKPWKDYAASTNAAVLLVTHTNRNQSQNPRDKYGLSVALRQVARSTLYAIEDPDTRALLIGPDKGNLSARAEAERFERTPISYFEKTQANDGTVPVLNHIGSDGRTIVEAVAAQSNYTEAEGKTHPVDWWLRGALAAERMK